MKRLILIILSISCLDFMGCCYIPAGFRGRTFEGRIVEEGTESPIEGVVVLGEWRNEAWTAGGAVSSFHDAEETVTDKNGEFVIGGTDITIFKAGYEYILLDADCYNDRIKKLGPKTIKWEGSMAIIPLKKLTMEERKKQGTPLFPTEAFPKLKIPILIKEINKEKNELGLPPYREEDWS